MKDFLTYIITNIVSHPDDVSIAEEHEEGVTRFHITVHPDDAGLVIGREGKVINSIRNLLKIQAIHDNTRVYLDLTNEKEETPSDSTNEDSNS